MPILDGYETALRCIAYSQRAIDSEKLRDFARAICERQPFADALQILIDAETRSEPPPVPAAELETKMRGSLSRRPNSSKAAS